MLRGIYVFVVQTFPHGMSQSMHGLLFGQHVIVIVSMLLGL
jgi:hypothetical protein